MRGPDCVDCIHWRPRRGLWPLIRRIFLGVDFKERSNSLCYSGEVTDIYAELARNPDGDCGPLGKYFERK